MFFEGNFFFKVKMRIYAKRQKDTLKLCHINLNIDAEVCKAEVETPEHFVWFSWISQWMQIPNVIDVFPGVVVFMQFQIKKKSAAS